MGAFHGKSLIKYQNFEREGRVGRFIEWEGMMTSIGLIRTCITKCWFDRIYVGYESDVVIEKETGWGLNLIDLLLFDIVSRINVSKRG